MYYSFTGFVRNPPPSARESATTFAQRKCYHFDARREEATNLMTNDVDISNHAK